MRRNVLVGLLRAYRYQADASLVTETVHLPSPGQCLGLQRLICGLVPFFLSIQQIIETLHAYKLCPAMLLSTPLHRRELSGPEVVSKPSEIV